MAGAGMAAALICSLVGCGGREAEWGAEAEQYFAGIHESWNGGFVNLGTFFAPEATIDAHTLTARGPVPGPVAGAAFLREDFDEGNLGCRADEPAYLAVDSAIDPSSARYDFDLHLPQAPVYEFAGTSGATRMTWTGSERVGVSSFDLRPEPVDRVAAEYLGMWTEPGRSGRGLYADGAVLRDTLQGVSLTGSQISDAAAAGNAPLGLRGASLREIPGGEGPAVYAQHNPWVPDQPLHLVVLLLDLPGEGACQPHVGVALWLDDQGRITREERYHRIDSVRSCLDTNDLPSGWWQSLPPPAAQVTGTVAVGSNEVTVWNGTPQREALLRWALQRFADAGMPAPAPTSVTFLPPVADPWTTYEFDPDGPDLILPSTVEGCADEGCDAWPTAQLTFTLTEVSRLWVTRTDSTTSWTRFADFAQAHGLAYEGFREPQSQQAMDRVVATVVWGLMDQPYDPPDTLERRTCDQLAADFQALTLATTTGAACPPSGG